MERKPCDIQQLLFDNPVFKVCAPMVRYSKLEFRSLVRKYGCQLCFSPMIIADSFIQSSAARSSEFSTNEEDTPLVVQFAVKTPDEIALASQLVSPFCDGVDINCGCPQRWAMKEGYGADLLSKPQLVRDMVRQVRNALPSPFSLSVKIRIHQDIRKSVELCRLAESAGLSFITVHGRTPRQRNEPVNLEAIKEIAQSVRIPVIANGDIKSLDDCARIAEETTCHGVMSAGGLLNNPALFSGHTTTPMSCVNEWISTCLAADTPFQTFHHHLVFMLAKRLTRSQRSVFNSLSSTAQVISYLEENISLPQVDNIPFTKAEVHYKQLDIPEGSYFLSQKNNLEPPEEYFEGSSHIFEE